eukprot:1544067-Amphidinium_carterae.1
MTRSPSFAKQAKQMQANHRNPRSAHADPCHRASRVERAVRSAQLPRMARKELVWWTWVQSAWAGADLHHESWQSTGVLSMVRMRSDPKLNRAVQQS